MHARLDPKNQSSLLALHAQGMDHFLFLLKKDYFVTIPRIWTFVGLTAEQSIIICRRPDLKKCLLGWEK